MSRSLHRAGHFRPPLRGRSLSACIGVAGRGETVTQHRAPIEGSYGHLNAIVVAFLQGRVELSSSIRTILASHSPEQVKAVLLNEGERYRRFNRARFRELVEALRLRGALW